MQPLYPPRAAPARGTVTKRDGWEEATCKTCKGRRIGRSAEDELLWVHLDTEDPDCSSYRCTGMGYPQ